MGIIDYSLRRRVAALEAAGGGALPTVPEDPATATADAWVQAPDPSKAYLLVIQVRMDANPQPGYNMQFGLYMATLADQSDAKIVLRAPSMFSNPDAGAVNDGTGVSLVRMASVGVPVGAYVKPTWFHNTGFGVISFIWQQLG